jgi:hypothetical protein
VDRAEEHETRDPRIRAEPPFDAAHQLAAPVVVAVSRVSTLAGGRHVRYKATACSAGQE